MTTKEDYAKAVVFRHRRGNSNLRRVVRYFAPGEDALDEPIKLVEVNSATVPAGVMPLLFGRSPRRGADHSVILVEVTPAEYKAIRAGQLQLPAGWGNGKVIYRRKRKHGG